jgi:hypothetical protein
MTQKLVKLKQCKKIYCIAESEEVAHGNQLQSIHQGSAGRVVKYSCSSETLRDTCGSEFNAARGHLQFSFKVRRKQTFLQKDLMQKLHEGPKNKLFFLLIKLYL